MKKKLYVTSQSGGAFTLLLLWMAGIAILFYLCVMRDLPGIQDRLRSTVMSAVTGTGAANASVTLDGRDVILGGTASSPDTKVAASYAAQSVFGVRTVSNQIELDESNPNPDANLNPAELEIQIGAADIVLHGLLPSDATSELLAEGVQQVYPTHQVENNIKVAAGTAEPVWLETTLSALSTIQRINQPEYEIDNNVVTLTGNVYTTADRDAIMQELALNYGDSVTLVDQLEVAPPKAMIEPDLKLNLRNSELSLSGNLRSSAELEAVASTTMSSFDLKLVNNEIGVNTDVAEAIWLPPLLDLIPQLDEFSSLDMAVSGDTISISGETASAESQSEATSLITDYLGDLLKVESNLRVGNAGSAAQSSGTESSATTPAAASNPTDDELLPETSAEDETTTSAPAATPSADNLTDQPATTNVADSDTSTSEQSNIAAATTTLETTDSASTEDVLVDAVATNDADQTLNEDSSTTDSSPVVTADDNDQALAEQVVVDDRALLQAELEQLNLSGIRFQSGRAILTRESQDILLSVASLLKRFDRIAVQVLGYTDASGNKQDNLELSQARAETVRQFLISQGIAESRLGAQGYGDADPIADNNTASGRALNRRIEFNY